MAALRDHPIIQRVKERQAEAPPSLTIEQLKAMALECGADDCGVVSLDDPLLAEELPYARTAFPAATIAVSLVCKMNRQNVRSPTRSVANNEFHHICYDVNEVGHELVRRLEEMGIQAINPPMAFPMELDQYPARGWLISHKLVAEAAGMGTRGVHRSVIHPKYGSFILLGTVLVAADLAAPPTPLDYNPCFECKLCVAACPVGALKSDGHFDFSACLNHNYQQFFGGFVGWIEDIAASKSVADYTDRQPLKETVKRWQSLSYGPDYNAAYCIAVCPAGEDVLGPYLASAKTHVDTVVKPLQQRTETLYVVKNTDAAEYAARKFPHKPLRYVRPAGRATTIGSFLFGLTLGFQRGKSKGLNAVYHFRFTGREAVDATVTIKDQRISVKRELVGIPDLQMTADTETWINYIAGRVSLPVALLRRKIRIKGNPRLMRSFAACFPK